MEQKWGAQDKRAGEGEGPRIAELRPDGCVRSEYTRRVAKVHLWRALTLISRGRVAPRPLPKVDALMSNRNSCTKEMRPDNYQDLNAGWPFLSSSGNVKTK